MTTDIIIVLLLTLLFSLFTSASIAITGNRGLISGDITFVNLFKMIFDWRFIGAMALAVGSRFTFVYINNRLLSIPDLAKNSTTITTFITALSYVFVIAANYLFLNERINPHQIFGVGLILAGIFFMLK